MAFPAEVFRIILGFSSAVVGMYFLANSSFSELQFGNHTSTKIITLNFLSALFILLMFAAPKLKSFISDEASPSDLDSRSKFFRKSVITFSIFLIVFLLIFLIKFPRLNIHSEYKRPCIYEQREKISHGTEYNLFAVGAFSLLALLLSFERQQPGGLGFLGLLIGLIVDASMEIKGTDGPNLWYMAGAALFCVTLSFIESYAESLRRNSRNDSDQDAGDEAHDERVRQRRNSPILKGLELLSAAVGIIYLSLSPFCKLQLEDSEGLKVVCFTVFTILLGACLSKIPEFTDLVVQECGKKWLAKAAVNSLMLMIASMFIFLQKYPRFKVHSIYRESCTKAERKRIIHGSQFDLYSAATFSLFALVISSDMQQPMEFGIFSFLLELTMDIAIENLENERQNAWYMVGAAAYCVVLIFLKTRVTDGTGSAAAGGRSVPPSAGGRSVPRSEVRRIRLQVAYPPPSRNMGGKVKRP